MGNEESADMKKNPREIEDPVITKKNGKWWLKWRGICLTHENRRDLKVIFAHLMLSREDVNDEGTIYINY